MLTGIKILRVINLAIFYRVAYVSDVLAKRDIILFLLSEFTILGCKDANVEKEIYRADLRWICAQVFNLKR